MPGCDSKHAYHRGSDSYLVIADDSVGDSDLEGFVVVTLDKAAVTANAGKPSEVASAIFAQPSLY